MAINNYHQVCLLLRSTNIKGQAPCCCQLISAEWVLIRIIRYFQNRSLLKSMANSIEVWNFQITKPSYRTDLRLYLLGMLFLIIFRVTSLVHFLHKSLQLIRSSFTWMFSVNNSNIFSILIFLKFLIWKYFHLLFFWVTK